MSDNFDSAIPGSNHIATAVYTSCDIHTETNQSPIPKSAVIEVEDAKQRRLFKPTFLGAFILVWLLTVVVTGSILTLCLFGWILSDNRPLQRIYFEVTSQILNALFTLSCVLTHPGRFIDLFRFLKLKKCFASCFALGDFSKLSNTAGFMKLSSKYVFLGYRLPLDAFAYNQKLDRFTLIIALYHLNCFFQYPITIVMWTFDKDSRPEVQTKIILFSYFKAIIYSFLPLSFLSGAIGGYLQYSSEKKYAKDNERGKQII